MAIFDMHAILGNIDNAETALKSRAIIQMIQNATYPYQNDFLILTYLNYYP